MSKPVLQIEVVSDVVCPWCYIGKRRLEQAIRSRNGKYDFQVSYLPFELNPATPESGVGYLEHLSEKFGGRDHFELLSARVAAVAAEEGLTFNHDKQKILPNTGRLHAIIQAAGKNQAAVMEAFHKAFFTDGVDLSRRENAVEVAVSAGMSRPEAEKAWDDPNALARIREKGREIGLLGIHSVPCFIINRKAAIVGAQQAQAFVSAFEKYAAN
jgi:predicted DsbA family dithiol-disulfide isomerase